MFFGHRWFYICIYVWCFQKKKIYGPSTNLNGVPLYAYGLFPKKTNQPQRTWNLSLSFCSKFSRWMPSCHQLSRSLRRWTILKSFLPAIKVFYFYIIHYMLRFVFKQNLIAPLAEVCKQDQTVPHWPHEIPWWDCQYQGRVWCWPGVE